MKKELTNSIQKTIHQYGWTRLLLAVSGGLDSICLAHFFTTHKVDLGIEWLGIAHVHHGLREGTADRDAEFVQNFATRYKVPFFLERLDGITLRTAGESLEENAREARYEALKRFAAENRADAILTAHHAGDQAETVYLRLRRGVSLVGLRGIQSVSELQFLSGTQKHFLFRPFLDVARTKLEEYARENNLQWCEDESNLDVKFARNQIRHASLPHLEKIYPESSLQLSRIAHLAESVYRKIVSKNHELFEPAIIPQEHWPFESKYASYGKVLALDLNILKAVFESGARNKSGMPANDVFGIAELFRLWLDSKGFRLPLREQGTSIPYPFLQRLQCKSTLMEKCRHILWICDVFTGFSKTTNLDNLYFSSDKFSGLVGQWRFRSKGDALWPADEKIKARKLEQWLREQGIPQWMHDSLPLFARGSRVFFVEGVRRKPKKLTN